MNVEWKLVPVEPTAAMIDAAYETVQTQGELFSREAYRAMLAAAPAAPVQAEPVWARPDQLRQVPFLCALYKTQAAPDLVPLYRHPPAAEVQRLREALKPFAAIDLTTNQAVDAMDVLRARRALEGK